VLAGRYAKALSAQAVQAIIAVGVVAALARLLGPTQFGIAVLLNFVVTIGSVLVGAGAQAAMLVTSAGSPENRPRTHGAAALFALGLLGVIVVVIPPVAHQAAAAISSRVDDSMVLLTAARIVPATYTALVYAALSGSGSIGWMGTLTVVGAISTGAAPVAALVTEDRLAGAIAGSVAGNVLWAIAALVIGIRQLGLALPNNRLLWRGLFRIGIPLHIGTVAYWLMLRADAFVVNALIGGSAVGTYGLALSLAERIGLVTTPIYSATASIVSGGETRAAARMMVLVVRLEIIVAAVATAAALLLGPLAIDVLAGPGYSDGALPLVILVVGSALLPVWPTVGLLLVSQTNDAWLTARVQIVVATLAIIGYWIATSALGIVGAAIVSTASYILLAGWGVLLVRRRIPFPLKELLPRSLDVTAARTIVSQWGDRRRKDPILEDNTPKSGWG
jgi:O-antigen/teichoic acid export membrane protein